MATAMQIKKLAERVERLEALTMQRKGERDIVCLREGETHEEARARYERELDGKARAEFVFLVTV